jgi:hypothetical protein
MRFLLRKKQYNKPLINTNFYETYLINKLKKVIPAKAGGTLWIIPVFFLIILIQLIPNTSISQQNINDVFEKTLSYRGLIKEDFTFPINFDEPSPTNSSKLILPLVKDLMINPLNSHDVLNQINAYNISDYNSLIALINYLFYNNINTNYTSQNITADKVTEAIFKSYEKTNELRNKVKLSLGSEYDYLEKNLNKILEDSDEGGDDNDIFAFNRNRDSSWAQSKRIYDILSKVDMNEIMKNSLDEYASLLQLVNVLKKSNYLDIQGKLRMQGPDYIIMIEDANGNPNSIEVYGGTNDNQREVNDDILAIIDFGGNDYYILNGKVKYIFDLGGNDTYESSEDGYVASAFFDNSFIYDKSGDDKYIGKNFSVGSAICGMAGIIDEAGNDFYSGQTFTQGAGLFGVGFILDNNGNDIYNGISYSQGFSMTQGIGMLIDNKGNDSYLIDSRSLDVTRYSDHYISMNQGFSYGLRPFYAGGIGLLLDNEGNDIYNSDIFGQGSAYWYALGILMDKNGNDKYNGYQYSQGGGIHFAIGLLKDYSGTDFYSTNGVSQGCGHDVGFGMLHDVAGDDNYSAIGLSQGAGNANGIGVFIDETGSDGYLNRTPSNTRGYGNYRRDYGSLGVFLDASGTDFYSMPGQDSTVISGSTYGISDDYFLSSLSEVTMNYSNSTNSQNSLKPDTLRNYSQDQLFIMAKTIEPMFAEYQKYGFNKLLQDSANTARYILKYLGSSDHRDLLVLTNLVQKIGYSMAMVFKDEINKYLNGQNNLNRFELAYMCSLIGFTRNAELKNELLRLTYDKSDRVISEAINTLGKIDYDKNDTKFIEDVSIRFSEIVDVETLNKGMLKNIAFAINNYYSQTNLNTLINLCAYNYYGVRFNAAEALKKYANDFYNELSISINSANEAYIKQALLNGFQSLDENMFMNFVIANKESLLQSDVIKISVAQIVLMKMKNNSNPDFQMWGNSLIQEISSQTNLKIK